MDASCGRQSRAFLRHYSLLHTHKTLTEVRKKNNCREIRTLTENAHRSASCTATSHVDALILPKSVFAALMRDQETTGSALAASAGKRMSDLVGKDKARHEAAKEAVLAGGAPEPPPQGEAALRVA